MTGQDPPPAEVTGSEELASVEISWQDGVLIVAIAGELDISNIDRIAATIHAQPNSEEGLVIDVAAVSYLDSSAISLLHDLAMRLRSRAQRLIVAATPGSAPRRMLELTALDANAPVVDSRELALKLLGNTGLR
ncbi:MAG: STAS domain-containing protein [Acidobacteriota bacterium]|nr:STAS domain-containing protein [Acidobacteriota bacterium]